jgi:hypothetical protein
MDFLLYGTNLTLVKTPKSQFKKQILGRNLFISPIIKSDSWEQRRSAQSQAISRMIVILKTSFIRSVGQFLSKRKDKYDAY